MPTLFTNREEAGRLLASCLTEYAQRKDVLVVGIPNGGVAVAAELARALRVELTAYPAGGAVVAGRTLILVDEGFESAERIQPLIDALRARGAQRVVAAAPALARDVLPQLWQVASDVAFLMSPEPLGPAESWYQQYPSVSAQHVEDLLNGKRREPVPVAAGRSSGLVRLVH